ncbi:nucleotidyltransferase family protein [Dechloromonas denitrificans]|uniref:nucleotidyltransferase domain-containing protein n=1 Tax=Dechloromonas denitrificans TaxID=281362 RepID=UPI001CF80E0A|nr:nucleotidyltransferase family protein [Dechloromonas denitrificans]UCV05535.1 nucleotidyltransferase family protein [Dechloromonas denitrificans]UCV09882.1 nucleotidyltransferase family protein [Dechloromonas denitrificans]
MHPTDLVVRALHQPPVTASLDTAQWDLLIRQARRANLLGKLAFHLLPESLALVPKSPQAHLVSALKMADRQDLAIRWEVSCISEALLGSGVKVILLKGAAYVMAGLPTSRGRTFSDVDILVPKERICEVESALMIHGWQGSHHDQYDQRYYREWMHEIPPMLHVRRGTNIDVHHTILPETARIKVNTAALLEDPLPIAGFDNIFVLKPVDMVLHSATHLFHEGELDNGLRDLFDLDSMFRHFGDKDGFWSKLLPRARELGLERPLYYAVFFSAKILDTPFPETLVREIESISPPKVVMWLMRLCYTRVLRPNHASCDSRGSWLARKALYIRSHWIRMPIFMLTRHLAHKAMTRPGKNDAEVSVERQPV